MTAKKELKKFGHACVCVSCGWIYATDEPFACENSDCENAGKKGIMVSLYIESDITKIISELEENNKTMAFWDNLRKENITLMGKEKSLQEENNTLKELNKTHRNQIEDLQFKLSEIQEKYKIKKSYLKFTDVSDSTKKTKRFNIYNKETDVYLGYIYWSGAWRQYIFSDGSLQLARGCELELFNFKQKLMDEWKENKKGDKN